ncbi:MAG: SIMPL domain-containing protein [Spirochaetaceae bacterium]|jgi:uncharacterized protein YggE|nr:SIMPL domain-containing protein [Spirochaetaceae bacterium]
MKRFFLHIPVVLAGLALTVSCGTLGRDGAAVRAVTVQGSARVLVASDRAAVSLSVVTRNADAAAAAEENARRMTAVQEAIKAMGVDPKSISTSNYTVNREMVYRDGANIPGDYRVTNRLNVSVKDLTSVGKLIDGAIQAGANEMTSLTYSSSDTEAAVKQARALAVTQAREAAQLLAETSGAGLGRVLSITELGGAVPAPRLMVKALADSAAFEESSTPISATDSAVTVTVEVQFELR